MPLDALRHGGRRTWPRREEERRGAYFVDRFDAMTLAMIVSLLALTILDGVLTIELLDTNSEEVNPFMAHLLTRGNNAFFLGKYLLTATGSSFYRCLQILPDVRHALSRRVFDSCFCRPLSRAGFLSVEATRYWTRSCATGRHHFVVT